MGKLRFCSIVVLCLLTVCILSISSASAERIYTSGEADGDIQYLHDTGMGDDYAPFTDGTRLNVHYPEMIAEGVERTWTADVQMPIASLYALPADGYRVTLNFYSFGMNRVALRGFNFSGAGIVSWDDYNQSTLFLTSLTNTEGWVSLDVTAEVKRQMGWQPDWVGFRFAPPGAGSLAASEDAQGRGAYLDVTPVPEPSSVLALCAGLTGLAGTLIRRRKQQGN